MRRVFLSSQWLDADSLQRMLDAIEPYRLIEKGCQECKDWMAGPKKHASMGFTEMILYDRHHGFWSCPQCKRLAYPVCRHPEGLECKHCSAFYHGRMFWKKPCKEVKHGCACTTCSPCGPDCKCEQCLASERYKRSPAWKGS